MKFCLSLVFSILALSAPCSWAQDVTDIGDRRELFVDQALIESMENAQLVMHRPHDEGVVVPFDKPWEGPFCGYATVIKDGEQIKVNQISSISHETLDKNLFSVPADFTQQSLGLGM